MLITTHLQDAKGKPLPMDQMHLVAASHGDFNAKVVASWAAMQLLEPGNLGAPITLEIPAEGPPDGPPLVVQVWLVGSTSAIPLAQR